MKITKFLLTVVLIFLVMPAFASKPIKKSNVHKNLKNNVKTYETITLNTKKAASTKVNKHIHTGKVVDININSEVDNPKPQVHKLFDLFNFSELVELSGTKTLEAPLLSKLDYALNNVVVDNTINNNNDYQFKKDQKIGDYIRVASWNIARGMNLEQIKQIFVDPDKMFSELNNPGISALKAARAEQEILKNSDVIILNEVDIGMPRTGYANVVQELAETLKYNYAYGVEFLEIDPVHLGLEDYKWSEERFLFPNVSKITIDENKYKGLHGSAILSKFPLENVRIIRLPNTYDWFTGERKRISELENFKRGAANIIFEEEMFREIRIGSRMAILADIRVPGLSDPVTIIATHLENRTIPKKRHVQLLYLLTHIYDISNPVVIGGDFNTSCRDGSPTGIRKEIKKKLKDPDFLTRTAISIAVPTVFGVNAIANIADIARMHTDPSVKSIPIISPNREREFFNTIRDFKFKDENNFDYRGINGKTSNTKKGVFANSNERAIKGFEPTFIFQRPLLLGKYKLDWFFVKSYWNEQSKEGGSYKLAPHYGRTLFELNYIFNKPISDHAPITVDLPINEPPELPKIKK